MSEKNTLEAIRHSPIGTAVSGMYQGITSFRNYLYDHIPSLGTQASHPVISIGNIRAGGTGKTPLTRLVAEYCCANNITVAILSRGYGRKDRDYQIIHPQEHPPWELVGDEPAMLHAALPGSYLGIGPKRVVSVKKLDPLLPKKSVYIMDDGFQHRSLRRNLDIVCTHDDPWEDTLLPTGFLRESPRGLSRAHIIILTGTEEKDELLAKIGKKIQQRLPQLKTFRVYPKTKGWINAQDGNCVEHLPVLNPILIAGIARPERFFKMVEKEGIRPKERLIFKDHHAYCESDFANRADLASAPIIMTEKDSMRLRNLGIVPDRNIWYLKIESVFADLNDERYFFSLIDKTIF